MRDLKMTRTGLKTASSLLLLVSIIQGFQDVQVDHYETMEAVVGQKISLPCIVQSISNFKIVSIEWSKKGTIPLKLALLSPKYGSNNFSSDSTLAIINNDAGVLMGTYLELHNVNKGHAGTYICELSTFPFGALKKETELRIKDKIECDMNGTIEVSSGENVTIHCSAFTNVQFTWTKNKTVVSNSHSLQLLSVSKSHAGLYKLTVDTGNKRLHAEFVITVRTQTSSLRTEVTTMSPHYDSSGSTETSTVSITSSATEYLQSTVTAFPGSYSQPQPSQNLTSVSTTSHIHTSLSYNQSEILNTSLSYNQSEILNTSLSYNQSEILNTSPSYTQSEILNTSKNYNQSETLSTSSPFVDHTSTEYTPVLNETTVNETELPQTNLSTSFKFTTSASTILLGNITKTPGATQTSRPDVTVPQDSVDFDKRSHLLVALIIVGGVLLTVVGFILYKKRMLKKRLDLPPPFKPPPPPLKYTAVRNPKQLFPTDRCNSISAEMVDINIRLNREGKDRWDM